MTTFITIVVAYLAVSLFVVSFLGKMFATLSGDDHERSDQ